MQGTGHSSGTISGGAFGDIKFVLASLVLVAILLWEAWPRLRSRWRVRQTGQPQLRYEDQGRSGVIHFDNGRGRFEMYWEFGGGDTLAVIDVPTEAEWVSRTGLPLAERADVLRFIAKQVTRDKTSTGLNRFEIGPAHITIFE